MFHVRNKKRLRKGCQRLGKDAYIRWGGGRVNIAENVRETRLR